MSTQLQAYQKARRFYINPALRNRERRKRLAKRDNDEINEYLESFTQSDALALENAKSFLTSNSLRPTHANLMGLLPPHLCSVFVRRFYPELINRL